MPDKPTTKLKPQVILLGFAALLNDVSSDIIYPLLPIFLTTTAGATPFIVGMIEGSAEALSSFLKLIAGAWSDRIPRRKPFIVTGYTLAAASRVMIAGATHWAAIFTARLVDRTGKGLRSAPRDALISDVTPPESRGRAFGFHRALDNLGAVAGPIIAAICLGLLHLPMRTIFLLAVIPGVIGVAMLALLLKEEARVVKTAQERRDSRGPLPAPFWGAMGSIAVFYLANSSDVFLLLQAHDRGVSTAILPLLWAAHNAVKAVFSTHAGAWSDLTDRRNLLVIGWLVYSAIYLAFPYSKSLWAFLLLFVVYAIPFTLSEGTERAWVADLVPADARGRSFGIYYLVVGLFTLGGTMLFGWLYQDVSHLAAFHAGAALALVAAVTVLAQQHRARPRELKIEN